jgi:hypothetical protein
MIFTRLKTVEYANNLSCILLNRDSGPSAVPVSFNERTNRPTILKEIYKRSDPYFRCHYCDSQASQLFWLEKFIVEQTTFAATSSRKASLKCRLTQYWESLVN